MYHIHRNASKWKKYELEFGLSIPQGWRGGDLLLEEENDPAKQYEFSKLISITADNIAFDSIYVYDQFIPFYSDGNRNKNIFKYFILLSGLAAITKRIKIGQIVTCNSYCNPLVANMLSTLDIISNSRVESGIGAGWYEQEYAAYGYQFPANVSRIKQLDESLQLLIKCTSSNMIILEFLDAAL